MKKLWAGCLAVGFSLSVVAEEQVVFVPQVGVTYKNIKFDQKFSDPTDSVNNGSGGVSEAVYGLSVSLTTAYSGFFASIKLDQSLSSSEGSSSVPFAAAPTELDRSDFVLTVGYSVTESISLFVGYLDGETTIEPNGDSTGSGIQSNTGAVQSGYEQAYEEDGLFIGATYGLRVTESGRLSFSLAYADLDASYSDNAVIVPFDFRGTADGISLAVTYSAPITDEFGYYVDLRYQQYDAEYDADKVGTPGFDDLVVNTEETVTAFSAGVRYFF